MGEEKLQWLHYLCKWIQGSCFGEVVAGGALHQIELVVAGATTLRGPQGPLSIFLTSMLSQRQFARISPPSSLFERACEDPRANASFRAFPVDDFCLITRPQPATTSSLGNLTTHFVMSYPSRAIPSHIRQPSMAPTSSTAGQNPGLIARVNEKKAELESLKELRDLSAAVASQMEALEQKLATLSDGTEGKG